MQPLEGLKVLDFCWVAVGPMTTAYLAEYGATVVRIESKRRPETLRSAPPFAGGQQGLERSGYFANYNANKFGLGLNMAQPQARELVKRLVTWADLVTENFTPGTLEDWGLGYEELCRVKPDIILFSTSMLGRGGPYSQQPGFGPVLASLSGMTGLTGWPDRMPTNPYGAYTDFLVPRFAVPAILAALDYRRRTGQGQHLDLSQLETSLHFMAPLLLDCAITGREPGRMGNRHPAAAPHGAYPCRGEDRWCTIACHSDVDWEAFCRVLGYPAWTQEERFATLLQRKSHEDELDALVGQWTQAWDAYDLMQRLQQVGVPAGVVQTSQDLFEDPQLRHRGHFVMLDHPEMGRHPIQRSEFRLSRAQAQFRSPAPLLGQHTVQVCKEILRMSDEEIAALTEAGVLE